PHLPPPRSPFPYTTLFRSTFLRLVDGTAVVGAKRMGKAIDLDRAEPVLDGAIHDDGRPLHDLVVGQAGWPAHVLQQRLLLRLLRSEEHTSELQSPDHLVCR